ncbi:tetratricopeptide repeat protein [Verrucomicrobiaceae bacterium 227]
MSEKSAPTPAQGPSPIGEISQEPSAFEAFLDANQKKLVIVGILAIVGLVAYVIYNGVEKMNNEKAAAAVADARTVPEFEAVSKEFEGENAGGSALIFKSQLQWRDQQQQEAIKTLEEFISAYPGHPALGSAMTSLGSYHQQLGNLEEAEKAFTEASTNESATSSLALLSLGDIAAQKGENDKAKEFYNTIITDYGTSHPQVKTLAEQRLKIVGVTAPAEAAPKPVTPGQGPPTPGGAVSTPVTVPGSNQGPIKITPTPIPVTPTPAPVVIPEAPKPSETTPPAEPAEETSEPVESTEGN